MDIEFFDEFDLGDLELDADALEIDDFGFDEEIEEVDEAPEGETTEARTTRILAAVQAGTQRLRLTEERHRATKQEDYYFCVYFPTNEQKQAFLAAHKWPDEMYIRGLTLAEEEGIVLPETPEHGNPEKRVDPKLETLAQEF